ncbi:MAG: DUF2208 family protein [Candidatus Bathyarchaeia archaeon]
MIELDLIVRSDLIPEQYYNVGIGEIMADFEVLYEGHATDLKLADRNMRMYRAILIFLLDVAILYSIFFIQIIVFQYPNLLVSMVVFFILTVLILPAPILITPSDYRILPKAVDTDGKRLIPLRPNYRTKTNEKRRFVSILHPRRGEFMRLYTTEPKKLQYAIQKATLRK